MIACFAVAVGRYAIAQSRMIADSGLYKIMMHSNIKMEYIVMMKDDKMMMMKGGKTIILNADMTLSNGTMFMMDGNVKMKNDKVSKMKESEMMTMNR